jgi:hypothetical protein
MIGFSLTLERIAGQIRPSGGVRLAFAGAVGSSTLAIAISGVVKASGPTRISMVWHLYSE